jgi:hypothetical protein
MGVSTIPLALLQQKVLAGIQNEERSVKTRLLALVWNEPPAPVALRDLCKQFPELSNAK